MKNIKIKICGMREPENLRQIAGIAPDLIGLIFYPKSPRFITAEKAETLPHFEKIRRVGVFVNETVEKVLETARRAKLFAVQLHGDETPAFCGEIRRRAPDLQIIKVFAIGDGFDGGQLRPFESACDYFLFDTKTAGRGGSGETFDWKILSTFEISKPFFLSGGIGAENVEKALTACARLPLYALDFNSRVETAPGLKSAQMIREIITKL